MNNDSDGNPLVVVLGVLGSIASIVGLFFIFAKPGVSISPHNQNRNQDRSTHTEVNPRAQAQINILERRYGSQDSLLSKVQSAETDIESVKRQISDLQQEQRDFYANKTFGGAARLNQWRAEHSRLRDELRAAESRLRTLESDYELWLKYESQDTK